jgi:hypothetical protein
LLIKIVVNEEDKKTQVTTVIIAVRAEREYFKGPSSFDSDDRSDTNMQHAAQQQR